MSERILAHVGNAVRMSDMSELTSAGLTANLNQSWRSNLVIEVCVLRRKVW
jgi:hypothetical protein